MPTRWSPGQLDLTGAERLLRTTPAIREAILEGLAVQDHGGT
jgi:hypothetical protein